MNKEPITPASLAAFITAHTIVPMIIGVPGLRTPVEGVALTQEQRAQLKLRPNGRTIVYELKEGEVIFDAAEATAIISFAKGDVAGAMATYDRLIKRDRPELTQREDVVHPKGGKRRLRVYEGNLAQDSNRCKIEVDYPDAGAVGDDNRFVVRVTAYDRAYAKLLSPIKFNGG